MDLFSILHLVESENKYFSLLFRLVFSKINLFSIIDFIEYHVL